MYKFSRFCAAAAAIVLGAAFAAGCTSRESSSSGRLYSSNDKKVTNSNGEEVSFFDYSVTINGEEITFPASLKELKKRGWVAENEGAASGYYEKDGVRMLFRMCEKNGDDYNVNGMYMTNRNINEVQFTLTTSAGVEMNVSTKDDVEAIYGAADKVFETGEHFYYEGGPDAAEDPNMDRKCFGFEYNSSGIVNAVWVTR